MINPDKLTPVEHLAAIGVYLKRDDLFKVAGVCGGKARSCFKLIDKYAGDSKVLVTKCSRFSPQGIIVSALAARLGKKSMIFVPWSKEDTEENTRIINNGGQLIKCYPGYPSVIDKKMKELTPDDAYIIPFGMECSEAVESTRAQTRNIPFDKIDRIVITLGSGMSLSGLLWGMKDKGVHKKVLAVMIGKDTRPSVIKWSPADMLEDVEFVQSGYKYNRVVKSEIGSVALDPHYEAKAAELVQPGDLFWIVGKR